MRRVDLDFRLGEEILLRPRRVIDLHDIVALDAIFHRLRDSREA